MKRVYLLAKASNERTAYLEKALEGQFLVERGSKAKDALEVLKNRPGEIDAVIVDNPSKFRGIKEIVSFLSKEAFTDLIPVILLSDETIKASDEQFLGKPVMAIVTPKDSPKVIIFRIETSIDAINSATFTDFSKMLKALPSMVYMKDARGRYVFASQTWHDLADANDPDWNIRGKTDFDIRKERKNAQLAHESDLRVLREGKGESYIVREHDEGGGTEYLQIIKEPLKNPDGSVQGIVAIINNVTAQENLRRELEKKSITDGMTGLFNRSFFYEYSKAVDPKNYPISLIASDCDDLKAINDTYGHNAGDQYILQTAALLKDTMPKNSIIFRMGGDEFLVILPRCDKKTAKKFLDALKRDVKKYRIPETPLVVSFGLATMRNKNESFQDCMAEADVQMYKDKQRKKEALVSKEK